MVLLSVAAAICIIVSAVVPWASFENFSFSNSKGFWEALDEASDLRGRPFVLVVERVPSIVPAA